MLQLYYTLNLYKYVSKKGCDVRVYKVMHIGDE